MLSIFFCRGAREISFKQILKKVREGYISPYCRSALEPPNFTKFGARGQLTDVITCVKFLVDRFRGYGVLIPPKLPFPIDLLRRPYNSVAPPCDTVINQSINQSLKAPLNKAQCVIEQYIDKVHIKQFSSHTSQCPLASGDTKI